MTERNRMLEEWLNPMFGDHKLSWHVTETDLAVLGQLADEEESRRYMLSPRTVRSVYNT